MQVDSSVHGLSAPQYTNCSSAPLWPGRQLPCTSRTATAHGSRALIFMSLMQQAPASFLPLNARQLQVTGTTSAEPHQGALALAAAAQHTRSRAGRIHGPGAAVNIISGCKAGGVCKLPDGLQTGTLLLHSQQEQRALVQIHHWCKSLGLGGVALSMSQPMVSNSYHAQTRTHMHTCTHTCAHTHRHTHTHAHAHTHTVARTHTHTDTLACTLTRAHTHTHRVLWDENSSLLPCLNREVSARAVAAPAGPGCWDCKGPPQPVLPGKGAGRYS